ncbi:MAG: RagB/SusD family nutrient uptake outer membrane protein [Prolixibacteraceae bacterium]|nr:RagB/SusD family nutrient uptake outer membrane protein [Prolixibacteraceae bacterium]NLX29188.1 RagB/SusD family nutrient uptake outer membrane protein [Bacteroidales bacterium]HPJ78596.1 RagB/SusD family nutrient uptake outer membrane protein [Prolixibacteraceae bacterium]HRV89123.1 RagB/SusD family nutrient uptake outer membrane protein [Prolixibacteraceae bacterium]
MKRYMNFTKLALFMAALFLLPACHDLLDEPAENRAFTQETDYTITDNMDLPLLGMYADFYNSEWEVFPLIAVRGDDVNAGGLGDQQDFAETDKYNYNKDYWMYNSLFQNYYGDLFNAHSAIEQIEKYKEFASNKGLADQYIAEVKVMRAWYLYYLTLIWGDIIITESQDPSQLLVAALSTPEEVMQHISDQMDEAIPLLPAVHPAERADIRGGITKFTALAMKARANLALKNYAAVAEATGQIISSGKYALSADFYNLFKIPGKLNRENLLELQYSDFGKGSGDAINYLNDFFGPQGWTPKVTGAGSGWGFYEPSLKYIKFMLDRNETIRLETSVLFTNRGIAEIKKDAKYATLPAWISNTTRSGDRINDYARAMFASGKHYLPSDQLTPGRTGYGTNKNFICIRYAEILLMHAEALTSGASSSVMSADAAVNQVRARAGLPAVSGVTNAQVMDEKYAELAMEWGTRFFDMVRTGNYAALSYDGRTFTADKIYLPYPQNQVDQIPALKAALGN